MPLYEHVFLARQDVSNAQVETLTKEFTDVLVEGGGKVAKNEYWGVKSLAFKIKKNRKAHFTLLNIEAPPAAVAEMERRMSISPDIIRFLTVRVEAHESEPSVMMRKSDRDDRREGDRGGFRGGSRGGGGGFRGEREGGREGGSTFRPRPPREGGEGGYRGAREGGEGGGYRGPREGGDSGPRAPRAPRPPRDTNPDSEG